jgi:hypothetical protein
LCLYLLTVREPALIVLRQGGNCCFFDRKNVAQTHANELTIEPDDRDSAGADLSLCDFKMDMPTARYVVVAEQNIIYWLRARFWPPLSLSFKLRFQQVFPSRAVN